MSALAEVRKPTSRPRCSRAASRCWSIFGRRGAARAACSPRSSRKSLPRNTGKAKFVKLNTDENPSIAGQYQVSGIPCLILFKDGQPVDRIVGYVPENVVTSMLGKHVA